MTSLSHSEPFSTERVSPGKTMRRTARFGAALAVGVGMCLALTNTSVDTSGPGELANLVGCFVIFTGAIGLLIAKTGRPLSRHLHSITVRLEATDERVFVPLLILSSLAFRLAVALLFPDPLSSDAYWYHARAIDLLEGRGYVRPGPIVDGAGTMIPTAFWPVGYSAFLAGLYSILGSSWRAGVAVNAVLSALTVWWLYRIGVSLFGRRSARFGAILICLCPLLWPRMMLSDTLFAFLILGGLAISLTARPGYRTAIAVGVILGAATYVRPNAMALVPVLCLVWAVRSGNMMRGLAYTSLGVGVVALALVPWVHRNQRELGAFIPVASNSGVNLLIGANDRADGRGPASLAGPVWDRVMTLRLVEYDEVAADRFAAESARDWIVDHPLRWVGLGFAKVAWMSLAAPWQPEFKWFGREDRPAPLVEWLFKLSCYAAGWLTLLGFGWFLIRCVRKRGQDDREFPGLLWVPILAWLMTAAQAFVFHGLGRLRIPVEGLLILAAAYVVTCAVDRLHSTCRPQYD